MKQKGLKIALGFLIVLIAAFVILNLTLDGIIKSAIEKNASELMQTEVIVESVNLSLFDGSGEINGFSVSNPEGFSEAPAVNIDETYLKIDLATIFSDTIIVEKLNIYNPVLFFEQEGFGVNLRKLNQNMELAEEVEGPRLVIDRLVIENGVVKVSSSIERERTAEARIENFELTDIGRAGNNTVKQSIREIMDPLLKRAVREALSRGLIEQLQNRVQDLLGGDDEDN